MNTVLVVDDEPLVVTLIRRALGEHGFHVISVTEPEEAIALCSGSSVRVDLLLTDLMMPRMNGRELCDRLRQTRPNLPVIYMSGYCDDKSRELMSSGEVSDVLLKPFGLPALLQVVKGVRFPAAGLGAV